MTMLDHNALRVEIGRLVAARERERLGERLIAAAVYGSVAHGAAGAHSDLELLLILAGGDPLEERDEHEFIDGVQVESAFVPEARMLAAARRVTWKWGLQADEYRHHLALWDAVGFFPRLRQVARDLEPEAFKAALAKEWWLAFELRNKALNALEAGDMPRAMFAGWEFAHFAALRIALYERTPYESQRTLLGDVVRRGYGMGALVRALTAADLAALGPELNAVWAATSWEGPEEAEPKTVLSS